MKTVIYLFNGCAGGTISLRYLLSTDKFSQMALKMLWLLHIKITSHNLFNNLHCHFIGIANSSFCFENIKNLILNFGPKKIISFNAFHPFDFDFHAKRFYKEADFYGKFDELGTSIRQPFKNYAHIRDQYFLLSQEKIQYKKKIEGLNLLKKNINFSKLISIKKNWRNQL